MDPTVEQRLDLLEEAISQLQTQQLTDSISGTQNNFEVLFKESGVDLSLPIQSSITLPKGYKAENSSGITVITEIKKPNYFIDNKSFENLVGSYFWFFVVVSWWLFLWLFAYYIKYFLFDLLFPKLRW